MTKYLNESVPNTFAAVSARVVGTTIAAATANAAVRDTPERSFSSESIASILASVAGRTEKRLAGLLQNPAHTRAPCFKTLLFVINCCRNVEGSMGAPDVAEFCSIGTCSWRQLK